MPVNKCPGPERKKIDMPEEVICPKCGAEVEMWTNETEKACPACAETIKRDELNA